MIGCLRNLRRRAAEHPRLWTILRDGDQLRDKERVMARCGTPNQPTLHRREGRYRPGARRLCRAAVVPSGIGSDSRYPSRSCDRHRSCSLCECVVPGHCARARNDHRKSCAGTASLGRKPHLGWKWRSSGLFYELYLACPGRDALFFKTGITWQRPKMRRP